MFKITVDDRKVMAALSRVEGDAKRAASMALNRVGITAKTVAAREITTATGIKVSEVKTHLGLSKASKDNLVVELTAKPWAPNLIRYQARQTRPGVTAKAWGKRKVYRGTFIANKGRTVFKRVGKARLPIAPVYGPSVRREFIRDHTIDALKRTARERYPIEFERAFKALRERRSAG